jgi:hypothetical protein
MRVDHILGESRSSRLERCNLGTLGAAVLYCIYLWFTKGAMHERQYWDILPVRVDQSFQDMKPRSEQESLLMIVGRWDWVFRGFNPYVGFYCRPL